MGFSVKPTVTRTERLRRRANGPRQGRSLPPSLGLGGRRERHGATWLGSIVWAAALLLGREVLSQTVNENFMNSTAPNWTLGGSGYTPNLTSGGLDPAGQGWLRLTDNSQNLATFAYYNNPIASQNTTVFASFDFTAWNQGSGGAADGITFFLFDGSKTFSVGANGGSLGYAQKTGVNGMGGGYMGLALDDWGNFSNPTEGRVGGPGQIPNAIAVRGPGSGTSGYAYINGTANGGVPGLSSQLDFPSYTSRPTAANESRHVAITLSPANQLSVSITFGTNAAQSLYIADLSPYTRPDTLKFGFGSGSGSAAEIHEIRSFQISSVAGLLWDKGDGSSIWGAAQNWNPDAVPAAGADVIFNNAYVNTAQTVDLGTGLRDVRTVSLDAPFSYTLQNGTLNFNSHGAPGQLSLTASAINGDAAQNVSADITTTGDLLIKNTANSLLTLGGTVNNGGFALNFAGTGNITADGVISGGGTLNKLGSDTLTLSGNNTYSGGTTLNAGTLALGNNNALGTGPLTINDGTGLQASGGARTISNTATLQGNTTIGGTDSLTLSGAWTQSGGDRTIAVNNTGTTTFSGGINLSESNTARTLTLDVAAGSSVVASGVIANGGTGAGNLAKNGNGTLTLSGANTYTGVTTVNAGTLAIGASDRLSDSSTLALNGGAFSLGGSYSERVTSLSYNNGTVDFGTPGTANSLMFSTPGSNAGTLSILNWESSQDHLAVLTSSTVPSAYLNGIYFSGYGSGAQILAGDRNQTIPGYGAGIWSYITPATTAFDTWDGGGGNNRWSTANNWVGSTVPGNSTTEHIAFDGTTRLTPNMDANWTVNALRFNPTAGAFTLGSSGGKILTFDGIVPSLIQQSANNELISSLVTLNQTTIIDTVGSGNLTLSGVVGGGGGLTKVNSGGKLILSGVNTYTGATTIQGGVVNMQSASALGANSASATVYDGATLELQGGIAVGNKALTLHGAGVASGGALRSVSGNNSWAGTVTLGDDSRVNSDAGTLTISGNISGPSRNLSIGGAGNVTLSGVVGTGPGGLTVDGSGTVTLSGSGANTYTGATVVNSGTLALNKTAGTTAIAGDVSIGPSGTVQLLAANQINDRSTVNLAGAGVLDLNGQNETIAGVNSISSSASVKLGAGTLTIDSFANSSFAGVISGAGSLVKSGTDTLTLSGTAANTATGNVTVNAGALALQKPDGVTAIAGSGNTITINTGGTLLVNANSQIADAVRVNLAGGTLDINTHTEAVGALTLTDNSSIDFSSSSSSYGTLTFAASDASTWTANKSLYIYNYDDNGGANSDFLYFGSSAGGLGAGGPQFSQVVFVNPNGTTGVYPGMIDSTGRIRPVPEPATIATVTLLLAAVAYRERQSLLSRLNRAQLLARLRRTL